MRENAVKKKRINYYSQTNFINVTILTDDKFDWSFKADCCFLVLNLITV